MVFKKRCSKCKKVFPATTKYFYRHETRRRGFLSQCKKCHKRPYIKSREYFLKYNYNITLIDYNKMFEEQEGKCKICGVHQDKLNRILGTDHNHDTGIVRGLLCNRCNITLGYIEVYKKDPEKWDNYLKN